MCRVRRLPLFGDNGKRCLVPKLSPTTLFSAVSLLELNFLEVRHLLLLESPCKAAGKWSSWTRQLVGRKGPEDPGSSACVRVWPLACPAQGVRDPALIQKPVLSRFLPLDLVTLWFFSESSCP